MSAVAESIALNGQGGALLNSRVLVLNRSYLPVHVTSVKRAFALLYQGIAKAVDEQYRTFDFDSWRDLAIEMHHERLGIVGGFIRVPRVLILVAYERVPKRHVRFSRFNIFARDNNTCQYCGKRFSRTELNLDHVNPRSQGGVSTWENIVCSCHACNRSAKVAALPGAIQHDADLMASAPRMDSVHERDVQSAALSRMDAVPHQCRLRVLEHRAPSGLKVLRV